MLKELLINLCWLTFTLCIFTSYVIVFITKFILLSDIQGGSK